MNEKDIPTGLEIAVIGMAGRFPGASHIDRYWENLKNGQESISFFSDKELEEAGVTSKQLRDSNYIKAKGVLENIEYFDASFFDYTPGDARLLDPQTRFFLECSWEALEDAGYDAHSYKGLIGCFVGAADNVFWKARTLLSFDSDSELFLESLLNNKDYMSLLASYKLNLKGPSYTMYTACSSSLVAIHLACQSILNGECDMALAGGVKILLPNKIGYLYQEGMIVSPDGHCRVFDSRAQGTIEGSGVGIVVLKRLEETIRDRDYIYAVICGSAINNDGLRKVGFTAPSIEGQAEVIQTAQHMAHIEPESITYLETHGTATELGDPVEIDALKLAFNLCKKSFCGIGSVKTNIGHLDTAAGVAGFIKVVLALKNKFIPPSLHFESPNPEIDFENNPFYVNSSLKQWKNDKYPLRAGVSSFGIGGTNAHVVLEESLDGTRGLAPLPKEHPSRKYQLMLLSAKTETALDKMTENLAEYFKKNLLNRDNHENPTNPGLALADMAYTLHVGRKAFKYRRMLVCSDVGEVIQELSSPNSPKVKTFHAKDEKRTIIFMFPGQGSQYVNMGLDLYRRESVFRKEVDRCFEILESMGGSGPQLKDILYPALSGEDAAAVRGKINQTEVAQPLIFIFEYALAKLLINWGIKPGAMIGHSIGEYVAAQLAGVFTLEDALKIVALRGKLMQDISPGRMLSVPLPVDKLEALLDQEDEISLAAVNSTSHCVVSGPGQAIDLFAKKLKAEGYESTYLHTSHAFHSKMMEPILKEFENQFSRVKFNKPEIPFISNVTGGWIKIEEAVDPGYWTKHLRLTIRFMEGINQLLSKENSLFIEVGPGKALSTFVKQHEDKKTNSLIINLVKHPKEESPDDYYLLFKIGQLWLYGVKIDWLGFYSGEKRYRLPLPTYPFERKRYWVDGVPLKFNPEMKSKTPTVGKKKDIADWFYIPSWKRCMLLSRGLSQLGQKSWWLMFIDEYGLGSQLLKLLENEGQDVIIVQNGSTFSKNGDREYTINPQQNSEYYSLLSELRQLGRLPQKIIHLWSVTKHNSKKLTIKSIKSAQDLGFFSLVYLVKAIGKLNFSSQVEIDVVTNNVQEVTGEEVLRLEKAMLLGALKTITQEYPYIITRTIDIFFPESQKSKRKMTLDHLVEELKSKSSDVVVAYRGNHRLVETFEPLRLDEPEIKIPKLKEKGIYLITGGLGEIGFALAEFLAKEVSARLILIGRSALPPENEWEQWLETHNEQDSVSIKIKKIKKLEKLGGEVLAIQANVASQPQMLAVINQADKRFGNINGVIHAAGITGGKSFNFINQISKADCELQFNSKVYGLLVLQNILRDKKIDFCLLTSSISSILGGIGFVAYAAANAFMDSFINKHNQISKIRWTGVNWADWQSRERKNQQKPMEGTSVNHLSMTPEEGIKTFQRILYHCEANRILVSAGDLKARIDQWVNFESLRVEKEINGKESSVVSSSLRSRPDLLVSYTAPCNQLEQDIVDIWQNLFGFEQIGIHDNFFELGGDSLKAIMLISHFNKRGYPFSLDDILTYPTVAELASIIGEKSISGELPEKKAQKDNLLFKLELGCVERLNRGNNHKNIFIIHPLHGMVNQYKELAVLLERDYNVYGIQARGLSPGTTMAESPKDMVNDYLEQIMAIQEKGLYIIGGYCVGNLIAYAIVKRLEKLNHQVEKLILIDGGAFSGPFITTIRTLEYLPGSIKKRIFSSNEKRFHKKLKKLNPLGSEETSDKSEFGEDKVRKYMRLLTSYLLPPGVIKAPILVPIAKEDNYPPATEEQFSKMTKSKTTVIECPGDHNSIFEEPYVENLAEILKNNI